MAEGHVAVPPAPVEFRAALSVWARVAALSFGGPAGQIAVMHRILVEEKRWVSEERFLHALNYCMLLPGPEAQQLAVYIGWLMHRTLGGLMAGILFVLPGFVSILALSVLYVLYHDLTLVAAALFGLKPAIFAVIVEAVVRIGRRVLNNRVMIALAASAFVAIFFLRVPFPLIVLGAGALGYVGGRLWPEQFVVIRPRATVPPAGGNPSLAEAGVPPAAETAAYALHDAQPTLARALSVSAICLTLWFAPLWLVSATLGRNHVIYHEGIFFSKTAMVTFGGAYAVLAYVKQQAVENQGWLTDGEMMDGLGMAETTPGPLIQVVQFVGFLGAYRNSKPLDPMTAAILGSIVTTWVTFVPCFFWIFLGAPYIERLRGNQSLSAALSAITAAVVGVILNLAVWFALKTLFAEVAAHSWQGIEFLIPDWRTLDLQAAFIAFIAFLLLFRLYRGMILTLAVAMALGIVLRLAF